MLMSCCTIDNRFTNVELHFIFYLFHKLLEDPSNFYQCENIIDFLMDQNIHPDIDEIKDYYGNKILHYA